MRASLLASLAALAVLLTALPVSAQAPAGTQSVAKVGDLVIEAPWTRATPGGAKVAGGYLRITNKGTTPDRLVGGTLPVAGAVEVHEMSMANNVMTMRRIEGLEIKPGGSVELKPGGYHLMFMELKEGLKAGQILKGTLVFEKAGNVEVEYLVAPIGAATRDGKAPAGKPAHSMH